MTEVNTSTLLAFAGLGYIGGGYALFFPLVFLVGLIFYALTVAKKWKELDASSVTELFINRYGKKLGYFASIYLIVAMMGFTATYVKSITLIFSPLFPNISPFMLTGGFVFITLFMTLRGGLIAIIRTDIVSFLLMSITLPLLLFFTYREAPNISIYSHPLFENASTLLPPRFIISLIILTMFTYILAPWYGQKIFSAKSSKVAFSSVLLAAFLVFVFYGIGVIATSLLRISGAQLASPDQAIPYLIHNYLPIGCKGLAYAVLLSICATTLAGIWNAMSSMILADFWKKSTTPNNYKRGLWLTLFFAICSFFMGNLLIDRILDKLILANIPIAALSFALIGGFYYKKTSPFGAALSIFTGLAIGIGSYLYFGEEGCYTWYWACYGIPLIFGTGILGSYLIPGTKPTHALDN